MRCGHRGGENKERMKGSDGRQSEGEEKEEDDEEVLKRGTKRVEERDGREKETLHIWAK